MLEMVHRPAEANEEVSMFEPVIIAEAFVDGVEIEATRYAVRLIAWAVTKTGKDTERRIVARLVMPLDVAREFAAAIASATDEKIDSGTRRELYTAKSRDRALDN